MVSSMFTSNWWTMTTRGVAAIVFGFVALNWPILTLGFLTALFGVYCFVDGVFSIVTAFKNKTRQPNQQLNQRANQRAKWILPVLYGVLSIAAGVIAFRRPGITILVFSYLIAFWALSRGFVEAAIAIQLRKRIRGEILLILASIISIAFGIATLVWPWVGAFALVGLVGAYAIVHGAFEVALSLRLREIHHEIKSGLIEGADEVEKKVA
jgi:uncharacterized membrane protein HdeD (DUF308 family)